MVIVLASIMRDATPYLDRYMAQVDELRQALAQRGDTLINVVCEGDSKDDTWAHLLNYYQSVKDGFRFFNFSHGGEKFGSVDHPTRWQNIARTWNHLLNRISDLEFDAFIYIESDLFFSSDTMLKLLKHLDDVPAVAPMSMLSDTVFYDTWGHRANGSHFQNNQPYHPVLVDWTDGLIQLDSAGSCKVMRAEVAKSCRLSEQDAMMGHDIYKNGYSLWLDPTLKIQHPNG